MKYMKNIEKFVKNQTVFCGIDIHCDKSDPSGQFI